MDSGLCHESESSVLSDLEEDSVPMPLNHPSSTQQTEVISRARFQELLGELTRERKVREELEKSNNHLKLLAHDEFKKREEAIKAHDLLVSEIDVASQILVNGIQKISGKIQTLNNFSKDELTKSSKYSALADVTYGVIMRSSEIADELMKSKVEVSQLASSMSGLRDAQRPLLNAQLSYISKIHDQVYNVIRIVDGNELLEESELSDSLFSTQEMDVEETLRDSLGGIESIYALAKYTVTKVRDKIELRMFETKALNETVAKLVNDKHHIGSLPVQHEVDLGPEMSEDFRILGEEGHNNKFITGNESVEVIGKDEVYTLAGAMQNISRESQQEVTGPQYFVGESREESSLLKAHVVAQVKELSQRKCQIGELEEKERLSNENVEGLMINITATGKQITRSKGVAEESAARRAVEQNLVFRLSTLRQELDEAKEVILNLEEKLKSKENIIFAAMAAKDAGDKSLRLADLRNSILKERLEDLCHQLESVSQKDVQNHKKKRYICWPWTLPGLSFVGYNQGETQEQNSNVAELSEPLL